MLFEYLKKRSSHTYDVAELKTDYGPIIPIFIYDQLMVGETDDHWLKDAMYFGHASTLSDDYVLMENKRGEVVLFDNEGGELAQANDLSRNQLKRVMGQLFGVSLDKIFQLDKMYVNGFGYERQRTSIKLHTSGMGILLRDVNIYIGNYYYWRGLVKENPDRKFNMSSVILNPYLNDEKSYRFNFLREKPKLRDRIPDFEGWAGLQDDDDDGRFRKGYGIDV
jgi:hypothetical protein